MRLVGNTISLIHQLNEKDMKNLNTIIAVIETLEAKRDNFTITFEEATQLHRLVELAESMVNEL